MFVLRWLILYQHAFLNKGFEKLTELFRKMEASEFDRNYDLGETIYVNDFVCSSSSLNYRVKIGITSDTDVENMNMTIKAEEEIFFIRCYKLEEELRMKEYCEQNVDGTLNICLSQETEEITFQNDYTFTQKLQQEQKNDCRVIMKSNETIGDEQVLIVCEVANAIDNDKVLLNELTIELRKMVNKYKVKVTTNKRKGTNNEIVFPITGKCTKQYDKRKGFY